MDINNILKKLSPKEQQDYLKLSKIFSSNLQESALSKGVDYISKNWKNYSKAMLIALLLNPNISSALQNSNPTVYKEIENSVKKEKNNVFDFSENFESGDYKLTNIDLIKNKLNNIKKFTEGKKQIHYKVKIIASESLVTNPNGLKKGELAQKRAENLQVLINKLGFKNTEIITQIGNTPYTPGKDNPRDEKYKKEQFVRIEIVSNSEEICDLNFNITDGTQGTTENKFETYNRLLSGTGIIEFKTGTIPDRLIISDENGKILKDLGYVSTQKHNYDEWNLIPLYVAELSIMSGDSIEGENIIKIQANNIDDLLQKLLKKQYDWKKDTRSEIITGIKKLEELINKGQTEFVIYKIFNTPQNIKFDERVGDFEVKVFSPVGKTGYSLKGNCN